MPFSLDTNDCAIREGRRLSLGSESRRSSINFLGFTLVEILIAMAIIAILATIAVPNYIRYRDRAKIAKAVSDIRAIEKAIAGYRTDNNTLPNQLSDIGQGALKDPWGNPYQYLPVQGAAIGQLRKDHSMVPVNSDYDLYSNGKDGQSVTPFTANPSQDDVVRARDGAYVGLVSKY